MRIAHASYCATRCCAPTGSTAESPSSPRAARHTADSASRGAHGDRQPRRRRPACRHSARTARVCARSSETTASPSRASAASTSQPPPCTSASSVSTESSYVPFGRGALEKVNPWGPAPHEFAPFAAAGELRPRRTPPIHRRPPSYGATVGRPHLHGQPCAARQLTTPGPCCGSGCELSPRATGDALSLRQRRPPPSAGPAGRFRTGTGKVSTFSLEPPMVRTFELSRRDG